MAAKVPNAVVEASYCIEDDKLIITKGTKRNSIDGEQVKQKIINEILSNNNDVQIEYPKLFIDNFNKKNQETNDKFRQIVLIFKNILLKDPKIKNLPSEIIETLVYNVPNNMLEKDDRQSILNVINFIRNNPLKSFKTIDEQDFAFASIYRGMSVIYCKHILKIIEHYLTNIK